MTIDMQKFRDSIQRKIAFHNRNHNDPHGVSQIVMCALMEVVMALDEAVVKESVDSNPEKD